MIDRSFTFSELDHLFLESGYLDEQDAHIAHIVLGRLRFLLNNPSLLSYYVGKSGYRSSYEKILGRSLDYSRIDSSKIDDTIYGRLV